MSDVITSTSTSTLEESSTSSPSGLIKSEPVVDTHIQDESQTIKEEVIQTVEHMLTSEAEGDLSQPQAELVKTEQTVTSSDQTANGVSSPPTSSCFTLSQLEASPDWGVVCLFLEQFLPHFFSTQLEVSSKKDASEAARYGGSTIFFKPELLARALLCTAHTHTPLAHVPPHMRKRTLNNASLKCRCEKSECQYFMQIFIRIMKLSAEDPKKIT